MLKSTGLCASNPGKAIVNELMAHQVELETLGRAWDAAHYGDPTHLHDSIREERARRPTNDSFWVKQERNRDFRQFAQRGTFEAIHVPNDHSYWRVVAGAFPPYLAPGDLFRFSWKVDPDGPPDRARNILVGYLSNPNNWSGPGDSILVCRRNAEAALPLPAPQAGPSVPEWHHPTSFWQPTPSAPPPETPQPELPQLPLPKRPPPPPPPPPPLPTPIVEQTPIGEPTLGILNVEGTCVAVAPAPATALVVVAASPAQARTCCVFECALFVVLRMFPPCCMLIMRLLWRLCTAQLATSLKRYSACWMKATTGELCGTCFPTK